MTADEIREIEEVMEFDDFMYSKYAEEYPEFFED
mgnify:CR=1 FL=1